MLKNPGYKPGRQNAASSISGSGLLLRENMAGWLYVLPALLPLLCFWIFPVAYSFCISFTNWDMMSENIKFLGLKNYVSLFRESKFYQALGNTLVFALGSTIPTIALGLLIALLLSGLRHGRDLFQTVIFSPYITPMVAVSIVWSWIFEPRVGILNFLLSRFGLEGLEWTQSTDTAMVSVIMVTVWKQTGWTMVFYVEALRRVPKNLLEAAAIDGAGALRRFFHVMIPMVSPTTFFLVIINTINSLQAYDQIQVLTGGGPAGATRTLLYYYYQEAFVNFSAGKALAAASILVFITVCLSLPEMALSKRAVHYG
ncbi:MAG: sugar ABC transporter permease [Spirochaetaceae bacterium]|jgi:multiple sugar transport system permease protein|nr:sugar ABC transporter permease [Spirochaetaceae bacterium]